MQIESIKAGKRNKSKLIIRFTDGSYIETRADDAYMLKAGDEVSPEEAERLAESFRQASVKASAARSLARRNMSKNELIKKLSEKGFSQDDAVASAEWFEEIGVIDDEGYAKSCAVYYKNRGYGRMRIKEELFRRGIPKEISDEVIASLPEGGEEIELLIKKKLRGKSFGEDEKRKTVAMLLRRGFKYDEIKAAFKELELDTEGME